MKSSAFHVRAGLLLALAALVPACGGGGSSGGGVVGGGPAVVVVLTGPASTSETGSTTTFTVALATLPSADVTIAVTSNDTSEGDVDLPLLTFTSTNGTTAQTVTVTGEDDGLLDGSVAYKIQFAPAVSTDANYAGKDPADIDLTNADDEVIGISVTPTSVGDLLEGATAQFTVALTAPATADVTVPITVTTGAGDVTVSGPGSGGSVASFNLVLTSAQPSRNVTIEAVDDGDIEATEAFTVATGDPTSADAGFDALADTDVDDVSGNVLDNDSASIVVTPSTASGGVTLLTSELGNTDVFQVRLGSAVVGTVRVTITVNDLTEGTVSAATLDFTSADAQTFKPVTVTGIEDAAPSADGDVEYSITLEASNLGGDPADAAYDSAADATVFVTNVDTNGLSMPPGSTGQTAPTAAPGIPLGGPGSFFQHEATDPTVVQKAGPSFEMWFRGRELAGIKNDAIGRAVSASPSTGWSANPSWPVLSGHSGIDWIRRGVGRPSVLFGDFDNSNSGTPDWYLLFYSGRFAGVYDGIQVTGSWDGVNGFGISGSPAFSATAVAGDFDELRVTDPCVIFDAANSVFRMWYTAVRADNVEQIGYATAPLSGNGPGAWTRQNIDATTPALGLGATGRFDADGVSQPAVVFDGATYHLWYTAFDSVRGRRTIGYAGSANPADFSAGRFPLPVIAPSLTSVADWSDENVFSPAVIKDGTLYRIWYSGTGSNGAGIGYVEGN